MLVLELLFLVDYLIKERELVLQWYGKTAVHNVFNDVVGRMQYDVMVLYSLSVLVLAT